MTNIRATRSQCEHLNLLDDFVNLGTGIVISAIQRFNKKQLSKEATHKEFLKIDSYREAFEETGLSYKGNRVYQSALGRKLDNLNRMFGATLIPLSSLQTAAAKAAETKTAPCAVVHSRAQLSQTMKTFLDYALGEMADPDKKVTLANKVKDDISGHLTLEGLFQLYQLQGQYDAVQFNFVMMELEKEANGILGGADELPSASLEEQENAMFESAAKETPELAEEETPAPAVTANNPSVSSSESHVFQGAELPPPGITMQLVHQHLGAHPELGGTIPSEMVGALVEANEELASQAIVSEQNMNEAFKSLAKARNDKMGAIGDKVRLILMSPPAKLQSPSVVEQETSNDNGKRQHASSAEDGKRQRRHESGFSRFEPGNATFAMGTGPTNRRRIVKAVKPMHTSEA